MAKKRRHIQVDDVGDVAVVRFLDDQILDEQSIQVIGDELFEIVDDDGRRKILLNFANVEFLSSAALSKLITLDKKVRAVSGQLRLCDIQPDLMTVFKITNLNKVLAIFEDEESALEAFT